MCCFATVRSDIAATMDWLNERMRCHHVLLCVMDGIVDRRAGVDMPDFRLFGAHLSYKVGLSMGKVVGRR